MCDFQSKTQTVLWQDWRGLEKHPIKNTPVCVGPPPLGDLQETTWKVVARIKSPRTSGCAETSHSRGWRFSRLLSNGGVSQIEVGGVIKKIEDACIF